MSDSDGFTFHDLADGGETVCPRCGLTVYFRGDHVGVIFCPLCDGTERRLA